MDEKIMSPLELKVTYIHDTKDETFRKTYKWLDTLLNDKEKIPKIAALVDPETKELLVYNGNKTTRHAIENQYNVIVQIINDQRDLDDYFKVNDIIWFGIKDFSELTYCMRKYVATPRFDVPVDEEMRKVYNKWVIEQHLNSWERREEAARIFRWHNDD